MANAAPRFFSSGIASHAELIALAIAAGLVLALYLLASLIARAAAPRLCALLGWEDDEVHSLLAKRVRPGLRHGIAALFLAVALAAWPGLGLSRLLLGAALGAAAALFALHGLRALSIPRWVSLPLAGLLFILILSGSGGGLAPVTGTLDSMGFAIGKRRITLLGLFTMAATCIALFAAVRLANHLIGRSINGARTFDPTQKLLAQKLSAIAVIVIAFFFGIDLLGIDLTALTVFSGAFGLAVGFGLQKTFGNLIAGIILLLDRSIKPGDVIVVGDSFGWVNKIGVRAVSVITRDGKEHLIPNETLMTTEVENWSYSDRNVRVRIPVGVSFDSDLKLAQQLMMDAALQSPRVLRTPKPNVWLTAFGESRVEHEILVWISDPESGIGSVRSDVLNRLWVMFQEQGIRIPYPQRDLHFRSGEKAAE